VKRICVVLVAALALLIATPARAHGSRTAYLELSEGSDGTVRLSFFQMLRDDAVVPRLPTGCVEISREAETALGANSRRQRATYRCSDSLAGATVGVSGLGVTLDEAVLRVTHADGATSTALLCRDQPSVLLTHGESWLSVARRYVHTGFEHILDGLDHIAFVVLLVLGARSWRRIAVAVSAFTVAHSLTLIGTALGLIELPSAVAEAGIALSLVLVALDVGRGGAVSERESRRLPLTASVFGLVHGLGFAGALTELGLPREAIAPALAGFNLGVELGQLVIVALGLGALAIASRARARPALELSAAYGVGGLGMYWLYARVGEVVFG
jgi:hydrogenase/urease accessory protein HupE